MMVAMDIVEFLEARIAEQESALREGSFRPGGWFSPESENLDEASLCALMLEECARKRAIIASWKEAADAEGISDPGEAEGTVAVARRAMLTILAGSHRDHPDYDAGWSPELPGVVADESLAE